MRGEEELATAEVANPLWYSELPDAVLWNMRPGRASAITVRLDDDEQTFVLCHACLRERRPSTLTEMEEQCWIAELGGSATTPLRLDRTGVPVILRYDMYRREMIEDAMIAFWQPYLPQYARDEP